jgi:hypothetical protein
VDASREILVVPSCGGRHVIAGVVAVAMGVAGCSSAQDKPVSHASTSAAPSASAVSSLTAVEAKRLSTALTARRSAEVVQALVPEVRAAYLRDPGPLLPAGSRMQISTTSFRLVGTDLATADATVTGSLKQRYQLFLAKRQGTWLILTTRKLKK